jgi:uncharacterized membrane protein
MLAGVLLTFLGFVFALLGIGGKAKFSSNGFTVSAGAGVIMMIVGTILIFLP